MAQDFYSLFGLGKDNKSISTIDASGIALAAIQELYKKSEEVERLNDRVDKLEHLIKELMVSQGK